MDNPFSSDKILRFPEQIAEWMRTGRTSAPIVVDMDLTNSCPHRCPRCPGEWKREPDAKLEMDEAIGLIRQFADMGTKTVSFGGGGDPLAHPDCPRIVEAAVALGMHVGVVTNAAAMTAESADRLADVCDWVRVSLDAATPQTFLRTHGVGDGAFEHVCQRIQRLARTNGKAVIGVGFLTDASTEHEMVDAAALVKSLGADYIQYRPYNHDLTDVSDTIRQAQAEHECDYFKVFASWAKYREMTEGYTKPYTVCHFRHFGTVLNARGEMHHCCDMRKAGGCIGSVRERSVREVWQDYDNRQAVADSLPLRGCPPLCRGNGHNLILDKIAEPIMHEVFL